MEPHVSATTAIAAQVPDRSGSGTIARKDHHLDLCLHADVGSDGIATGLGGYALEYDALPELDLDEVDLSVTVLGKKLRAPIVIGAMTGGTDRAATVNQRLARGAARCGVGMALGSQRAMIARPDTSSTFIVKEAAPDLPLLFANVGAVQLNLGVGKRELDQAIARVGADAINVHLNALQEAVQPEGDTCFRGLAARLADVLPQLAVPALAKEVGAGISARAAKKIAALPLRRDRGRRRGRHVVGEGGELPRAQRQPQGGDRPAPRRARRDHAGQRAAGAARAR